MRPFSGRGLAAGMRTTLGPGALVSGVVASRASSRSRSAMSPSTEVRVS